MTDMQSNQRDEKEDEKRNEKSWEEKRRRDPLATLGWAVVLIWAGFVLLADNFNLFDQISIDFIADMQPWSLIFGGAGIIVLALVVVRLLVPEYRGPVTGNIMGVDFNRYRNLNPPARVYQVILRGRSQHQYIMGRFKVLSQ